MRPTSLLVASLLLASCASGEPTRGISPAPENTLNQINSELSKYSLIEDVLSGLRLESR